MDAETVLSWVAIGGAASLAGMIWPFRRGPLGIAVNALAGVCGAVLAGLLSFLVLPWSRDGDTPVRLLFAALGALSSLALVHGLWNKRGGRRRSLRHAAAGGRHRP